MKGSDFIFDCVYLLRYNCHKTPLNQDKSYIDSPDLKKKHQQNLSAAIISILRKSCIK